MRSPAMKMSSILLKKAETHMPPFWVGFGAASTCPAPVGMALIVWASPDFRVSKISSLFEPDAGMNHALEVMWWRGHDIVQWL